MNPVALTSVLAVVIARRRRRNYKVARQPRRLYINQILAGRENRGEYFLVKEIEDHESYFHFYFRMNKRAFDKIYRRVESLIEHPPNHRYPIEAKMRLVLTLRYLCSGINISNLAFSFRVSPLAVSNIVRETLIAIWDTLHEEYLKTPTSTEEWLKVAEQFWQKWQFPNCLGAMDGKHCRIRAPSNSGTEFYNYKGFFSIVLLALVDADYKFIYVDIGAQGSLSDGGILMNSEFGQALDTGNLNLPKDSVLPGSDIRSPYVFLGDSGFQLKPNFLRPYPITTVALVEKIFNYRLSRARRVSENAFGIFAARFRILFTCIDASDQAENIVKACVVLHNFIKTEDKEDYLYGDGHDDGNNLNGNWRDFAQEELLNAELEPENINIPAKDALKIRSEFANYFNSHHGSLPWQTKHVTRKNLV